MLKIERDFETLESAKKRAAELRLQGKRVGISYNGQTINGVWTDRWLIRVTDSRKALK